MQACSLQPVHTDLNYDHFALETVNQHNHVMNSSRRVSVLMTANQ